jgi:hypothetical protein
MNEFVEDSTPTNTNDTRTIAIEVGVNKPVLVFSAFLKQCDSALKINSEGKTEQHCFKNKKTFIQAILESPEELGIYEKVKFGVHSELIKPFEDIEGFRTNIFDLLDKDEKFYLLLRTIELRNDDALSYFEKFTQDH